LLEQRGGPVRFKGATIVKIVKSDRVETPSAALWTPWGTEHPAERQAQRAALRRVLRRVAELRRREKKQLLKQ